MNLICCDGDIQKGERHIHEKQRQPRYDADDNQIGIDYFECRSHNKDCFPRLSHFIDSKNIMKNCNFGVHKPTYDLGSDSCDDSEWCEWCGKEL